MADFNGRVREDGRIDSTTEGPLRQQALSKAIDAAEHEVFLNSLSVDDRAALLSEMLPGASAFLEATPSKEQGLAWDPDEFVTELAIRLQVDMALEEAWCPLCDCILDCKGRHAGLCGAGGDRTRRHHGVRNLIGQFACAGGKNPELEKPDLLQPSPDHPEAGARRPADVYLPSWTAGCPAALDIAVSSPHRQDIVLEASASGGAAAEAYENFKRSYKDTAATCLAQGISFIPMVAEPSGGWGPSGLCTLKALARAEALVSGKDQDVVFAFYLQRLSTAIRKSNARAFLCRQADLGAPDTSVVDAAAAAARDD